MTFKDIIKNLIKKSPIAFTKNHRYDLQTKQIIRQLNPSGNSIDVGCHKGEILELLIKSSPQGHHFGIEPISEYYQQLKKDFSEHKNYTFINIAASDEKGSSEFNFVVSNPSYSGLKKRDYDRPHEVDKTITVKTDLLDNVIPEGTPINLIKIDVEGAEMQVLKGAQNIIHRDKPLVIFEHGVGAANHYNTTPDMIFSFFEKADMQISNLDAYLKKSKSLTKDEFNDQFYQKKNYYFIAHPKH